MEIRKPIQLSKSVYCLLSHTNIGIIENENDIILIDSGINRDDAKEIDKIIQENFNKKIDTIINTHSNADHAGGNKYFFEKYNCKILTTKKESAFLQNPYLESAILWGAHPFDKIRTSYFECESSSATEYVNENTIIELNTKAKISFVSLPGHFIDMIGISILDSDNKKTIFLGDSIFGAQMIQKYSISYMMQISEFINTLDKISKIESDFYIPSHSTIITSQEELQRLVKMNKNEILNIQIFLLELCKSPMQNDDILAKVFESYHIRTTPSQIVLIGSTIKNHLTDLYINKKLDMICENGRLYWQTKNQ
jgi:glyoxylase-like metal-dependent hydrolase (beta-lactamase superfamily II)